jgi:hypothetical protein
MRPPASFNERLTNDVRPYRKWKQPPLIAGTGCGPERKGTLISCWYVWDREPTTFPRAVA